MLRSGVGIVLGLRGRLRLGLWVLRSRVGAVANGSSVELDIDPSVQIGRNVRIQLTRGSRNRLKLGPRTRIRDDVLFQLGHGTIEIGPDCELREGCRLNVAGHLVLEGRNILSWGTTIHCRESIVLREMCCCSEYVTIVDSRHFHSDAQTWFYDNSESRPVEVGRNAWVASKAVVLMGAQIGDNSLVAANSVVGGKVEPGTVVAGSPARPIRASLRQEDP